MECPVCNTTQDENAIFCPVCGRSLKAINISEEDLVKTDPYSWAKSKCYKCGVSEGVILIPRNERVGCLVIPYEYCPQCYFQITGEQKAFSHNEDFCNKCEEKFKRPYFKNRIYLEVRSKWTSYTRALCPTCIESEAARLSEYHEYEKNISPDSPPDPTAPTPGRESTRFF
jgi:hypothetical protein